MEEALRALLLADAGVSALSPSINWGHRPQGEALPAIVLTLVSGSNGHDLDGPDTRFAGTVQVDCYASTYGEATMLSRAAREALDGYAVGDFHGIFLDAVRGGLETGDDTGALYRVALDFQVMHSA